MVIRGAGCSDSGYAEYGNGGNTGMAVIEIPDEQAAALRAYAAAQGMTLEAWLKRVAEERAVFEAEATRRAVKQIREIQKQAKPYPEGWTARDYMNYGRH